MRLKKDGDLSIKDMLIAGGLWLLQNRDKEIEDMDEEYLIILSAGLDAEVAKLLGEVH
jgi:hypothetical protein